MRRRWTSRQRRRPLPPRRQHRRVLRRGSLVESLSDPGSGVRRRDRGVLDTLQGTVLDTSRGASGRGFRDSGEAGRRMSCLCGEARRSSVLSATVRTEPFRMQTAEPGTRRRLWREALDAGFRRRPSSRSFGRFLTSMPDTRLVSSPMRRSCGQRSISNA